MNWNGEQKASSDARRLRLVSKESIAAAFTAARGKLHSHVNRDCVELYFSDHDKTKESVKFEVQGRMLQFLR